MSVQTCLTNPFLTPDILMSHNVFSRCHRRLQYLRDQHFFLVASPSVNPQVRIDVETFFQNHGGMNSTIGNVKQVFRYSVLHLRDRFSPTLFYSRLFEEAADGVEESTTAEKIWKSSTRNKKWKNDHKCAFLNDHTPKCAFLPKPSPFSIFSNRLSNFFNMFGRGLYSSSCKFPLNFELLFSTAFSCVFVSVGSLLATIQQW